MAEKKEREENDKSDVNRDFLEKSGVSEWMRDVLAKIVTNRPQDPIAVLAQYFENIEVKSNKTTRAYQLLTQTDHTRAAFQSNASAAYEILSSSTAASSKSIGGIGGSSYQDLLSMICRDVPKSVYSNFLKKVGPREHEVILYDVYHSGIVAAFILVEFYHRTQALFSLISFQKDTEAVVDSYLAETLVTTLTDSISESKTEDPIMLLEAGARFSDEEFSDEIIEAMSVSESSNRPVLSTDAFMEMAVNVYLLEIKPVR